MAQPLNRIPTLQAAPHQVGLLRARDRNFRYAKWTQGVLVGLAATLPVLSFSLGSAHPEVKPYVALASLFLLLVDVGLLDKWQKERMKRGGRLQEEFDAIVLGLAKNDMLVGSYVDREELHALSAKRLSPAREAEFETWYVEDVAAVPLPFARLICQRTNIVYDSRLRTKYATRLLFAAIAIALGAVIYGILEKLTVSDWLVTVAVPCTPLLAGALKEFRQQANACTSLANIKTQWEKVWKSALAGASEPELATKSRQLQDLIFQHRCSCPLVFDWVYKILREGNEDEAGHAVKALVREVQDALEMGGSHEAA